MLFSLENRTAVVTGASKGLGASMAVGLAAAGADIVGVASSDMSGTRQQVEALGRRFAALRADLADAAQVRACAASALDAFGQVDILLNNAGITLVSPTIGYSEADFDRTMNINLKAVFLLSQLIGEHMVGRGYGRIIHVASIQGLTGSTDNLPYVASKHAVVGMTKCMANDWGPQGVTTNAIAPGFMLTDNTAGLRRQAAVAGAITERIPCRRWGKPEDLVGAAVFLASDAASYVNGHTLVVDGGYLNT